MIQVKERQADRVILEVSGTIEKQDYEHIVPQLEKVVDDYGKIRALVEFNDFDGWKPNALVDELRFDIRHRNDVKRLAILGESKTQEWLTRLAAPIFSGEVRFFPKAQIQEAKAWLDAA